MGRVIKRKKKPLSWHLYLLIYLMKLCVEKLAIEKGTKWWACDPVGS